MKRCEACGDRLRDLRFFHEKTTFVPRGHKIERRYYCGDCWAAAQYAAKLAGDVFAAENAEKLAHSMVKTGLFASVEAAREALRS